MDNKRTYIYVHAFPPHPQEPVVKNFPAHHWLNEIYLVQPSKCMGTRETARNRQPVKIPCPDQACPSPSETGNKNGCQPRPHAKRCIRLSCTELPTFYLSMTYKNTHKSSHCSKFWDIKRRKPIRVSIDGAQVKWSVLYTCNGTLHSCWKERGSCLYTTEGKEQQEAVKWEKQGSHECVWHANFGQKKEGEHKNLYSVLKLEINNKKMERKKKNLYSALA